MIFLCFKELLIRTHRNFQADSNERYYDFNKIFSLTFAASEKKIYTSQQKCTNFAPNNAVRRNPCAVKYNKRVIVIDR